MNLFSKGLIALFACSSIASATHYRVYLIGGQSNGNGRGDTAELSVPPLDTEGLAGPQTDIRFYWHKTQSTIAPNGTLTQDTWIDLQPGSGHGINNPSGHPNEFGAELSFGRDIAAAYPDENIAIIKYTHGGTNLHTQWSASGTNYASFIFTVESALAKLTEEGHTYDLSGMIWVQGESDTGNTTNASNYQNNLIDLIERVRADIDDSPQVGGYTLPFLISGLSNSQYSDITTLGQGTYIVRQAQETVGALPNFQTAFVDTDDLTTYPGTVHFNAEGQINIGKACAVQMLALEANDIDRDGLLLSQEMSLGTDPIAADSDDDGQTDGFEVAAGTDPLSGTSFFQITEATFVGNQVTLQWPSLPRNTYQIEVSQDLVEWSIVESNYAAGDQPSTTTTWTGGISSNPPSPEDDQESPFVIFDAEAQVNGNFNTPTFDSSDTNEISSVTRLAQGGSLTGGGANLFVLNRTQDQVHFEGRSDSGWPGFNFGGINTANQAAAAQAGDFFTFIVGVSESVTYESLRFFTNQFGTTGQIDVSYAIGNDDEVFVAQGITPETGNAPVTLEEIDFPDFTTDEDVQWTFYLYNSGGTNFGIRFDDITLIGPTTGSNENENDANNPDIAFFRVRPLP